VQVFNPSYAPDEFTDRWPENKSAQAQYSEDLRKLVVALHKLKSEDLSLAEKREVLKELFGETAAAYAVESTLDARRREMHAGRMHIDGAGKVLGVAAPAVVGMRSTAARAATREGGGNFRE
jgi:hypothetical protein